MNISATLTSLAMLKVDIDVLHKDYLDYLVPFVVHVLKKKKPSVIDDRTTSEWIRDTFGLVIPATAVHLVLKRLTKKRLLEKSEGIYRVVRELPEHNIEVRQAEAKRHIDSVLNALMRFAREEHSLNLTSDETNELMLAFLAQFSVDCLRTYTRGTALPEVPIVKKSNWYIINAFVKHVHLEDLPLFESLIVIVKANMLANALICPDLDSFAVRFKKVTFYLDTPIILNLLNLHGENEQQTSLELIEIVRKLGGNIKIFQHTTDEVRKAITGTAEHIEDPDAWPTRVMCDTRRQGKTRSGLLMMLNRLDSEYQKLGIVIRNTPKYDESRAFQIDEVELEADIDEEVQYYNPYAKKYDINSVRSIYALRKGVHPRRLEEAVAVFVTNNTNLAKAANKYAREHESLSEVEGVVTDFSLANVAWLKAPLGAPDLPKRELIATAYAALAPDSDLWGQYLEEIEKLEAQGEITVQDHELLRHTLLARDELMNLTLGAEEALTKETITEILKRVKAELVSEKEAALTKEKSARAEAEQESAYLKQELESRNKHLYWVADTVGRYVATSAEMLLFIIIALVLAIPSGKLIPLPRFWGVVSVIAIAFPVLTILNLYTGVTVRQMSLGIQKGLTNCIYRRLTISPVNPK